MSKMSSVFLKSMMATVLFIGATANAQEEFLDTEHDHDDAELHEQIRAEQNEYFEQLNNNMSMGVWSGAGSCKYISSIFQPPPTKTVALTFDDGPSSTLTPVVLDVLKKYGIKATFFMQGNAARKNPNIVKRVAREGHIVASHSFSHPNFHTLSQGNQASEITTTDSILRSEMPAANRFFRYPYGNSTCSSNSLVHRMGYRGIVGWHVDSCDWAFSKNGYVTRKQAEICAVSAANTASFVGHVVASIRNRGGGIVLLHEIHSRTVYSLEEIIVRLQRDGYKFTNLDDPRMASYLK